MPGAHRPPNRRDTLLLVVGLMLLVGSAEAKRPLLITVDDLPAVPLDLYSPAERDRMMTRWLDAFDRHGVKAVGLVRAQWIEGNEALLRRWLARGHTLGNHSWSHPSHPAMTSEAYLADLEKGRKALETLQKTPVRWFRFPYLREGETRAKRDAARAWLTRTGQKNLPVTIDTADWAFARSWATEVGNARERVGADYLAHLRTLVRHYERLGDRLHGRETPQILLLHLNSVGADHIDALLTWLAETHEFVDAATLMADPAFATMPDYVGHYGVSYWWRQWTERTRARDEQAIRTLFSQSVVAWNAADLPAFVSVYAEDARFVSREAVHRGRAAVLALYETRYPDKAAMGALELTIQHLRLDFGETITVYGNVEPVRPTLATVIARWRIRRDDDELTGATTLVLQRSGNRWLIVEDHSS